MVPPNGTPAIGLDRVTRDISWLVWQPTIIHPFCLGGMTPLEVLHGVRSENRQSVWIAMLASEGGLDIAVVRDANLLSEVELRVALQGL